MDRAPTRGRRPSGRTVRSAAGSGRSCERGLAVAVGCARDATTVGAPPASSRRGERRGDEEPGSASQSSPMHWATVRSASRRQRERLVGSWSTITVSPAPASRAARRWPRPCRDRPSAHLATDLDEPARLDAAPRRTMRYPRFERVDPRHQRVCDTLSAYRSVGVRYVHLVIDSVAGRSWTTRQNYVRRPPTGLRRHEQRGNEPGTEDCGTRQALLGRRPRRQRNASNTRNCLRYLRGIRPLASKRSHPTRASLHNVRHGDLIPAKSMLYARKSRYSVPSLRLAAEE